MEFAGASDMDGNGAFRKSDIEGKAAREAASECGQRASFNGANGMSDIEGKAAREAASECGQRASFNGGRGSERMEF